MQDRRTNTRRKTFLGGRLAFNRRQSSMNCLLRNISDRGAKLTFDAVGIVPDEFDLEVDHVQRTYRARVTWRGQDEIGVVFLNQAGGGNVVPLDHAIRVRQLEAEKASLQRRVAQLSDGGA